MINKFQSGGQVYFSAVANPYSNAAVADRAGAAASSSKSDEGLISKEIMNELYKKGIPVDVDKFSDQLYTFEKRIEMGLPVSKRGLYALKSEANRIIQQAGYLENAEKLASKNEAIGEIAVGNQRGRAQLYVTDKNSGKIREVDITQYDIEKDGPAMTVNELIEHRKFNPNQAFDTTLTQIISSNIGMSKINDYIRGIINTIGEATSTTEAYTDLASLFGKGVTKPTKSEFEAIQRIAQEYNQLGPDALFKLSQTSGSKNIQEAFAYIMRALPRDMQIQLQGRSVASGNSIADSQKELTELIISSLAMSNKQTFKQEIDYQESLNKKANGTSGGSSKTFYQTPNEAFFDGDLNKTTVKITDNAFGNKSYAEFTGVQMPSLTTDEGKAISNVPMGVALSSSLLKYTDKSKIYMGEQKITEGMLNNIAYSGDQVAAIYMPVKDNGDIDWEGFHAFTQAEEYISEQNITDIDSKNMIHARFGSYAQFDREGNVKPTRNTARYMVTYGYTIDDHISDDNRMVEELTGDAEKDADALISQIYNKKLKNATGVGGMGQKNVWDDIFRVPIFIKIDEKASGDAYRYGGNGSSMTPRTLQEDMMSDMANQKPAVSVTGNTSLLYQE